MPADRTTRSRSPSHRYSRTPDGKKIPRPTNSWILFRAATAKRLSTIGSSQGELSRQCAAIWRSLPPTEKTYWDDLAAIHKAEHKRMYPNYVFQPMTAAEKQQNREKARAAQKTRKVSTPPSTSFSTPEPSSPIDVASRLPPLPTDDAFVPFDYTPARAPSPPPTYDFAPVANTSPSDASSSSVSVPLSNQFSQWVSPINFNDFSSEEVSWPSIDAMASWPYVAPNLAAPVPFDHVQLNLPVADDSLNWVFNDSFSVAPLDTAVPEFIDVSLGGDLNAPLGLDELSIQDSSAGSEGITSADLPSFANDVPDAGDPSNTQLFDYIPTQTNFPQVSGHSYVPPSGAAFSSSRRVGGTWSGMMSMETIGIPA